MNAKQKETAAKWVLAIGASALFVVSLNSTTVDAPTSTTTTPAASTVPSDHHLAGNHRSPSSTSWQSASVPPRTSIDPWFADDWRS